MIVFFLLFFTVYSAVNYYIFIRGWQALQGLPVLRIIYLVLFLTAALSYIAARVFSRHLPVAAYDILTGIGSFWFAYILYIILFLLLFDIIRLGNHFFDFYPRIVKDNYITVKQISFAAVFIVSSLIILAGYINTRNLKVNTLNIEIDKGASSLNELKAVVISDLHLSSLNNKEFLDDVAERVNALSPDIILMPGDIVDDKSEYLLRKGIGPALGGLKAKYGVYASMGNHEFINGGAESEVYIRRYGIKLLRDEMEMLDGLFYVAGRDDTSKAGFTGERRKTLKEIIGNREPGYPVLLMDHTPWKLEEAAYNKIDLQVSGHTHHGQLYPLNFITGMIYEISWGYKRKNNTHFYVSSGVGTWGPRVRTGSDSEIVVLNIRFR